MSETMTLQELDIMVHATGWDAKRKRDRLYRNHYVSDEDSDNARVLDGLCERGLMSKQRGRGWVPGDIYRVTDAGIELLKRWRP